MAHLARLKLLSHFLKELPEENFKWSSPCTPKAFAPVCGTKACIAGWSQYLFGDPLFADNFDDTMPELDITKEEANFLCYAAEWQDFPSLSKFGPMEEAIKRVDALIKHYEEQE